MAGFVGELLKTSSI